MFRAILFVLVLVSSHQAVQAQQPLGNILGGVVNGMLLENARREWNTLSPIERFCFDAGLRRSGNDPMRLMQQGIAPSDPRLENLRGVCSRLIGREMAADVECTMTALGGRPYVTRCREGYARIDQRGNAMPIGLEEAIQDGFAGRGPEVARFERPDAANRRREQLAAGGAPDRVLAPSFSCERGKKPAEVAICNSYELTRADLEYGELWQRAKAFDPKGEVARQLQAINRTRDACGSSVPCIRDALEKGVTTVAALLRANGVAVATASEAAVEERKRQSEEKARADEAAKVRAEQAKVEAEAAREQARIRAEQAKVEAEAAREQARIRAEQAKVEAEAAREQARLKAEQARVELEKKREEEARREADAAEFAAYVREAVGAARAGRKPGVLPFPPVQKDELTDEEKKLAESACGVSIGTRAQAIDAFRLMRSTKNDIVLRACRAELGFFELAQGRTEAGHALMWSSLDGASASTGRMFLAWLTLSNASINDRSADRKSVCAVVDGAQDAFLAKPSRVRDGGVLMVAGLPTSVMVSLSCDEATGPVAAFGRLSRLCAVPAPDGKLDAFAEQSKATCWLAPSVMTEFRERIAKRLLEATATEFEEQRLALVVSSTSEARRNLADKHDECRTALQAMGGRTPGELAPLIRRVDAACRTFMKS